jgi:hypothetical protein
LDPETRQGNDCADQRTRCGRDQRLEEHLRGDRRHGMTYGHAHSNLRSALSHGPVHGCPNDEHAEEQDKDPDPSA